MKELILVFTLTLVVSCTIDTSKEYEFIIFKEVTSIFNEDIQIETITKIITAKSDSIAYIDAFTEFCIRQKISSDMKKTIGDYSTPKYFELKNQEGINIAETIRFSEKIKIEENIKQKILFSSLKLKTYLFQIIKINYLIAMVI